MPPKGKRLTIAVSLAVPRQTRLSAPPRVSPAFQRRPGLGFGDLVEAVQVRSTGVGKFDGPQGSEARAAQDRDRETPEQVGGGGHACLGEHDDVDVVDEALDVPGDAVDVAGVVTGLEEFPHVKARRIGERCVAPADCGAFLEQLPTRRERRVNRDHKCDAAAVSNGALGHRSVDTHDGSLDLPCEAFRQSAERGAGADDRAMLTHGELSQTREDARLDPGIDPVSARIAEQLCVNEMHIGCSRRDLAQRPAERRNMHVRRMLGMRP